MRFPRISALQVLSVLSTFVLISCNRGPVAPIIAPEEVLRRAAQRSQELDSASFVVDSTFTVTGGVFPVSGSAQLKGVLHEGGNAMQLVTTMDAVTTALDPLGQKIRMIGKGDVIMMKGQDVYFRMQDFSTTPDQTLFQKDLLARMLGMWWHVPEAKANPTPLTGGSLTPSPSLLRAQSQVVKVLADEGTASIDGRTAYHISVGIDQDKLMQFLEASARAKGEAFDQDATTKTLLPLVATGQMWVDSDTFSLLRVSWTVDALVEEVGGGVVSGTLNVGFSDFNTAPPIIPPTDAQELAPGIFPGSFPVSSDTSSASSITSEGFSSSLSDQ